MYLEGPAIFNQICIKDDNTITSDLYLEILAITTNTYVQFSGYIEISQCTATFAINANEIHIAEYSTINFTENTFSKVKSYQSYEDTTSMLASKMLRPCIFQYISRRGNLDNEFLMRKPLNYLILFNSNEIEDFSPGKYSIVHCGWNQYAAFVKSDPRFVNQKVMKYVNDSLENYITRKEICYCGNIDFHEDCYQDELGPFYPGQLIDFYFIITMVHVAFHHIVIKIEDGPESACGSSNKSVLTELHRDVCTNIKYTILHKSSQECDLYLKAVPRHRLGHSVSSHAAMTEIYYIILSACPIGFTLKDRFCKCDSVLHSTVYACDINDQTVMRHANNWISGNTVNNSHSYHVSKLGSKLGPKRT